MCVSSPRVTDKVYATYMTYNIFYNKTDKQTKRRFNKRSVTSTYISLGYKIKYIKQNYLIITSGYHFLFTNNQKFVFWNKCTRSWKN